MKTPITVLTVGLGLLVIASRAHAITMVRAGQAEAVIVIPAGSKAAGAADLQSYVEKVSGAKLEIVTEDKLGSAKSGARVFVGPCLAASRVVDIKGLQPEGFVIKTDGDDLFIVGRDATDLQACVDKAAAAIGSSDAAALERVRLVATGLEYTQKTRDLLAAAAAVRAGKSTREEFNKIKAETDKYYGSLGGSLAVRVSRDIQSCLSLTPDFK